MSLLLLSYKYYFDSMEASKSAAVAVFLALIIIVLTLIYLRISRPKSEEKMFKGLKQKSGGILNYSDYKSRSLKPFI